jgi:asparagine synthase (glutamine-hydrolysing)
MCGITGIFLPGRDCHFRDELSKMAVTISNRGPDDHGCWYDEKQGIGFAHRRLSIIDLSKSGQQPMESYSKRYVIVFNGEIYNYKELKKDLETESINWRGSSDTEIMLAAIDCWGLPKAVSKFNGMFAFALWDKKKLVLSLCRDRLGIKPLYYARIKNGLLFASEIKAIKACSEYRADINITALGSYLKYHYIPEPDTIFKDTWKLKPGNIIQFSSLDIKNNMIRSPEIYWDIQKIAHENQKKTFRGTDKDAIDELDDLLNDSVNKRMISDVPLGAFLSGGIDSSVVVSIMQAQTSQKINTFTIGSHEDGYDEGGYAKKIASYLGTNHTELYIDQKDAINVIPKLSSLYDEPFSDASQIPLFLVSKLAREHVTVSLSGDGGDELFGGYNRHFLIPRIWKKIGKINPGPRKLIAGFLQSLSPVKLNDLFYKINKLIPLIKKIDRAGDKIHKFSEILHLENPEAIYESLCSNWKNPEKILNGCEHGIDSKTIRPDIQSFDISHRTMFWDLTTYLPGDILTKLDRATMGVSLEGRVPILDHRIVEFAWSLPLKMKIRNNRGKWVLRQVLDRYLPREFVDRPKSGFDIPMDTWLRRDLRDWVETLLNRKRLEAEGFFNADIIRTVWKEHLSGKTNQQYQLWNILMFQSWLETNMT